MNFIEKFIDRIYWKPQRRKIFEEWEKAGAKNETE